MAYQGLLPNLQRRGLGERLAESSVNIVPQLTAGLSQMQAGREENEALRQMGLEDLVGLSPDLKKIAFEKSLTPTKQAEKQAEAREKAGHVLNISQKMRDRLSYTGSKFLPGKSFFPAINRESLQKREEFDSLAASYASYFRDLETKGQLPLGLYEEVIKPRLPDSELSDKVNLGRIEGMDELAREYGGLEKDSKKSKSSKPLFNRSNKEHMAKFDQLKKAGYDRKKIEEILSKEFSLD